MVFSLIRSWRRRRILSEEFPEAWHDIIQRNVWQAEFLTPHQLQQLRNFVQIFVAEKHWEGCDGLRVSDEIMVTIAGQASLLAMGSAIHFFEHVLSILIYPAEYASRDRETSAAGVVTERETPTLGQAVWRGPVILSWEDVLAGGRRVTHGENLVLHEFAHQVDMRNGRHVDGIPPLSTAVELRHWQTVLNPVYERLKSDCQEYRRGALSCYGAQNAAEFFAVLVEAFFENGHELREQHPDATQLLAEYFQLNPAEWPADGRW